MIDPLPVHSRTALAQLHSDIGTANLARMLDVYRRESESQMKAIATAFGAGDAAGMAALCHSLRSSTESLGFTRLAAMLLEVEMAASHGNDESRTNFHAGTVTQLMAEYEAARPYLEAMAAEFASGGS